ncbi:hypothetical protein JOB18_032903 [Solea senegalensis]|uniref:Protein LIAT1 n=1 Tax=Solea senegalensis TaxID=28829 RepID=A0AAV6SHW4_SOLSE|nr:protein LIAT1 isoform X1 [Solea senegalensis]KAG7516495.1 hypothetical protein JOB18_032903 [Solea senegalensis]
MPENKTISLLIQTPNNTSERRNKKKTRKKRSRNTVSTSPPQSHATPQTVSLHPVSLLSPGQPRGLLPKLRAASKKGGEQSSGSGWRSKKHPKSLTPANKTRENESGAPAQGFVSVPSSQARESLRWEGELGDPRAEEQRLELYRADRRQRYITHRAAQYEALIQTERN